MFSGMLIAGMDVDCSVIPPVPHFADIEYRPVLNTFLNNWLAGNKMEKHLEGGLAEDFTDVTVNAGFRQLYRLGGLLLRHSRLLAGSLRYPLSIGFESRKELL